MLGLIPTELKEVLIKARVPGRYIPAVIEKIMNKIAKIQKDRWIARCKKLFSK